MNTKLLALVTALSASALSAQPTRHSLFEDRLVTHRPDSLQDLPQHPLHVPHAKHLPLGFHDYRLSFDGPNVPVHKYAAMVHASPFAKRRVVNHLGLEVGVSVSTKPHLHYHHGHEEYAISTNPGVVFGVTLR